MLLLLGLSFAQESADLVACSDPYLTDILPAQGAVDVPVDVAPVVLYADDCLIGGTFGVSLLLDGELIAEGRHTSDGSYRTGLARAFPDEPLLAETTYTLLLETDAGSSESTFTTGDSLVHGAEAPLVSDYAVSASELENGLFWLSARVWLELGDDPDSLSVAVLRGPEGDVLAVLAADGVLMEQYSVDEPPADHCVYLGVQDGSGFEAEPEELCAEVEVEPFVPDPAPRGCSTAPLGLPLVSLLGLVLGVRRRR